MVLLNSVVKSFFGVFLLILLFSNQCFAQLGRPISVPVLQESKIIDELLDRALKDENKSDPIVQKRLKDSCISLEMFALRKDTSACFFQLSRSTKSILNIKANQLLHHSKDFGFFTYKGILVLVSPFRPYGNLFSTTPYSKSFSFIFYSNDSATYFDRYDYVLHYQLKKGRLSEGMPEEYLQVK